jgi:hypothetical protein
MPKSRTERKKRAGEEFAVIERLRPPQLDWNSYAGWFQELD